MWYSMTLFLPHCVVWYVMKFRYQVKLSILARGSRHHMEVVNNAYTYLIIFNDRTVWPQKLSKAAYYFALHAVS